MENILGYIIFVSYNRNEYDLKGIEIDDMTIEEFIEFCEDDDIDCKTISIDTIYDFTDIKVGGGEKFDDCVYWFISSRFAKNETISKFIEEYDY